MNADSAGHDLTLKDPEQQSADRSELSPDDVYAARIARLQAAADRSRAKRLQRKGK